MLYMSGFEFNLTDPHFPHLPNEDKTLQIYS